MKRIANISLLMLALAAASCNNTEVDPYDQDQNKDYNDFDFSTVNDETNVSVNYTNTGVKANVYFEIYDENPLSDESTDMTKRSGIAPLFAGFTDENGIYNGKLALPAYLSHAYVYTSSFFAKTLMEGDVVNGQLTVFDEDVTTRGVTRGQNGQGKTYLLTPEDETPTRYKTSPRWKQWLGSFDVDGKVDYAYYGTEADLIPTSDIYTTHSQIINEGTSCPVEYRISSDLKITEDAEVVVTYLGGNTNLSSTMGYYFYKEGEEPATLQDVHPILIFPNTQDGKWCKMSPEEKLPTSGLIGVDRMTSVKLKFYPNIAQGSKEGETNVFPAGYKVGLMLVTNAWSKRLTQIVDRGTVKSFADSQKDYWQVAATNSKYNIDKNGRAANSQRVACYKNIDGFTIASFEDAFDYDQNFSDVVVAIGTNPVKAIIDVPAIDNGNKNNTGDSYLVESSSRQGCYLFEDLWPKKGDYDMNDVVVEYNYLRKLDKWNDTYGEGFEFTMRENYAANQNGFGFKITGATISDINGKNEKSISPKKPVPGSVKLYALYKGENTYQEVNGLEYDEDEQVYIVTDNVQKPVESYLVRVGRYGDKNYKGTRPSGDDMKYTNYKSQIDPFIWKTSTGGKRWEVHCTNCAPTKNADYSYFGTGDDASNIALKRYYVRDSDYPFAIYLSGASVKDVNKLLQRANEGKSIDTLYPSYIPWVQSKGAHATDWYKSN